MNSARTPQRSGSAHSVVPPAQIEAQKNGTFQALATELADKGKAKANARAGALAGLYSVYKKSGLSAEPFVVPMMPAIIEAAADKMKPVSIEADKLAKLVCENLSPHAVTFVLPFILAEADGKWQSNLLRVGVRKWHVNRCMSIVVRLDRT